MKQAFHTDNAPKATGPFSQVVKHGNLIYTSGSIHLTPDVKLVDGTIEEKTHVIMKNLQAILGAADASFDNVLKATIYVTDMSVYGTINKVYGSYLSAPYPAREVVCVKELPMGAEVEISMVAALDE